MSNKVDRALGIISLLGRFISRVIDAVRSGDDRRVDELLADDLATTIAARVARDEANAKFGAPGD